MCADVCCVMIELAGGFDALFIPFEVLRFLKW
jgi:hypothetical protein